MAHKGVSNAAVARALRELALFLQMDGVSFKPLAYERSASVVGALQRPLTRIHAQGGLRALQAVPGVGKAVAEHIAGMLETGFMADLERLRRGRPIDIIALTSVEGVGVRRVETLWRLLRVTNLDELRRAAQEGQIRSLPHFGARSEQQILEALSCRHSKESVRARNKQKREEHRMNVIVGIDDSSCSNEAIRYVCEGVWPKDTRFLVVSVVPVIVAGPGEAITGEGMQALTDEQERVHGGLVRRAAAYLRKAGLKSETLVVHGDPRTVLTDRVRSEQADLLIVGSHGRTGLTKLLLGSVATHVVTHSECPVLVVKTPSWKTPGHLIAGSVSKPRKAVSPIV